MTTEVKNETLRLIAAAQKGDKDAAQRMIEENSGLIWSVARRFFGRGTDSEDLYQLGCVGFLKALDGFDPEYGTQFSTYAVPKIAGEIHRFLRDDGTVKVSRAIKSRAYRIGCAKARLAQQLGREPGLKELSEETGMSPEEIASAETAGYAVESLQKETGQDGLTLESLLGNTGIEEAIVERVALREAVDALSDKEKKVILLRFFKSLTQQQTARIMGVSQVQISRIERKAVLQLKKNML